MLYGIFALFLLSAAAALWHLYISFEEQHEREGFLYRYAAFFAYVLLAAVFVGILFIIFADKPMADSAISLALELTVGPLFGPIGAAEAFTAGTVALSNSSSLTPSKFRKNRMLG